MGKKTREFIAGPIYWDKFCQASKESKGALMAFVILSHIKKLTGRNEFRIQPSKFRQAGVPRNTWYSGVKKLEEAGLLRIVDRHQGRAYTVNVEGFCGENRPKQEEEAPQ